MSSEWHTLRATDATDSLPEALVLNFAGAELAHRNMLLARLRFSTVD